MTNVIKMNLDHIADDIRHVTEILKAREEAASQTVAPTGQFDIAAEIRKETERAYPVRDAATQRRLDLLQADITQAMMDFGISPVVDRIVAARNDALVKGAAW